MGARAYRVIENYADRLSGAVVEIGSDRGEGSTKALLEIAANNGLPFFSYDMATGGITGESWLADTFPKSKLKIAFAYLDNFDWTYEAIRGQTWYLQQVADYASQGVELNNENSKRAHFIQAQLVHKHAAKIALILFDDTYFNPDSGEYIGKGGSAIPWLEKQGWTVTDRVVSSVELFNGYVLVSRGLWS